MPKTMTVRATITAVLAGLCMSAHAIADSPKPVNIPAGDLRQALLKVSEQFGADLVFSPEQIQGIKTGGAHGELTTEQAVTKLLEGTPLELRTDPSGAMLIAPPAKAAPQASTRTEPSKAFWSRLAQADTRSPSQGQSQGEDRAQAGRVHVTSATANGDGAITVEEILVTAQRRSERLQDVPISISVLSGDSLDESVVPGATEALSRVPGVAVSEGYQGGTTNLAVRGVTASSGSFFGSSPIGYYLDSVPFGFVKSAIVPDLNVYDLERIEVLRGPQGTLYGASAQNGVVRVLTKDADLNAFELKSRAAGSTTDGGGTNYRADGAVNVPLIEGKLAARVVAGYQNSSGWLDKPNKNDFNDADLRNVRLKVNAQPTEQLAIGMSAWLSRSDFGGPSTSADNGRRTTPADEPIAADFDTYSLKASYDFSAFSLTSMTSYLEYENQSFLDGSTNGTNLVLTRFSADTFAQEINLASTFDGAWRWTAGGIYRDSEDRTFQRLGTNPIPLDRSDSSESFAIFGELTRIFGDGRVELTGGLRYFEDRLQGGERSRFGLVVTSPLQPKAQFDATSPRVILTWRASPAATIYASYAEGFRSGLYQTPSVLAVYPQFPPAKPDTLKNYEIGAKGNIARSLEFDVAAYYMDWRDVQQSILVAVAPGLNLSGIINSESASGVGVDVGLTARLAEGLELGLNGSWNDLTLDSDVHSGAFVLFEKGDRLNLSAEYTVGASADYSFGLGSRGYKGRWSVSSNLTSPRDWRTLGATGPRVAHGDQMIVGRTSFSIDSPHRWTAALFVENVTNEDGSPARQPFVANTRELDARIRPRTYGVQVEYRF